MFSGSNQSHGTGYHVSGQNSYVSTQANTTGMSQPSTATHGTDHSMMNKTVVTEPAKQVVPAGG